MRRTTMLIGAGLMAFGLSGCETSGGGYREEVIEYRTRPDYRPYQRPDYRTYQRPDQRPYDRLSPPPRYQRDRFEDRRYKGPSRTEGRDRRDYDEGERMSRGGPDRSERPDFVDRAGFPETPGRGPVYAPQRPSPYTPPRPRVANDTRGGPDERCPADTRFDPRTRACVR